MCRTFAKTIKFLSAILIAFLLLFCFFFSGCGCTDKKLPSPPSQNNEENSNPEENNENSENSSENEPETTPSSPETESNNSNETPTTPPTSNPPTETPGESEENGGGGENSGEENNDSPENNGETGENDDPSSPPPENEPENQEPEEPTAPVNNFSLSIKTFEAIYSYSYSNETFEIDFSKSKTLYFEIKLLNNSEIVENVNFNICLSNNSFGIFDSVIYNSVYIEIQKVGEFEITISSTQHNYSKTLKVVVISGEQNGK